MSVGDYVVCILILSIPVIYILLKIEENKITKKKIQDFQNKWTELEKTDKYHIEFMTIDYQIHVTEDFPHYRRGDGSTWWCEMISSKRMANNGLIQSYSDGFFTNIHGITFPTCNILTAEIKRGIN